VKRAAASVTAAVALALVPGLPVGAAAAAAPRASLTDIENDVMCVACHEPLAVADSPQAEAERAYVRGLIAQGLTKPQIERQLVGQYGPSVLGKPPAHGFNLTVYVLPPALVLIGLATLAFALPRWRRRTRAAHEASPPTQTAPSAADTRRLEEDLSTFRG
jgi:cytochrome c-type biogenesis protein CcmH/NrfF